MMMRRMMMMRIKPFLSRLNTGRETEWYRSQDAPRVGLELQSHRVHLLIDLLALNARQHVRSGAHVQKCARNVPQVVELRGQVRVCREESNEGTAHDTPAR